MKTVGRAPRFMTWGLHWLLVIVLSWAIAVGFVWVVYNILAYNGALTF